MGSCGRDFNYALVFSLVAVMASPGFAETSTSGHGLAGEISGGSSASKVGSDHLMGLSEFSEWKALDSYSFEFDVFHPQGIKKVGNVYYLSSVDKSSNSGFLFSFTLDKSTRRAVLKRRVNLTEIEAALSKSSGGARKIHPGGLDYNSSSGELIVPLSVYSRRSPTSILAVPTSDISKAKIIGESKDHLGTAIFNNDKLRFANWGTEEFYSASTTDDEVRGKHLGSAANWKSYRNPKYPTRANLGNGAWEYQDCKGVGSGWAVCASKEGLLFRSGTLDIIQFDTAGGYKVKKRIPVPNIDRSGAVKERGSMETPLTFNPMDFEPVLDDSGAPIALDFMFAPHDGSGTKLLRYRAPISYK